MPPEDSHKRLTPAQKELFRRWVAEGAVYESHWAYAPLVRPAVLLIALVTAQVMLGAFIVWTRKAAVPTTAHVATGAAVLATSLVLALRAYRLHSVSVPASTPAFVSPSGNPRHDPTALVDERIPA